VKRRILCASLAVLCFLSFPFSVSADALKIFQGYMLGAAAEDGDEPSGEDGHVAPSEKDGPIPGYVLDGVTAEGGDPANLPDAPSYTVTFQPGDGATVQRKTKTVTNGRAYGELPDAQKSGYALDGWFDASGAEISANTRVSLTGNQTLYAHWSVLTYEVRFDANGGSVKQISMDVPAGGDYGELPRPVRDGYAFDGWHTQAVGGERVVNYEPLLYGESHTLYAHWTALSAPLNADGDSAQAFQDVPATSCYYAPVRWAVERGITSGTSAETFSPNAPCKRRHILTFLWRANGSPATELALSSVTPAALWAYENAIIPAEILYRDEDAATRSDAVTYLWKLAGSPDAEASLKSVVSRFTDVAPESEYASAVAWALDHGITNGTTATTFSPDKTCTRGQIVTFLYRCYAD
jgi:uncharacterized repeat protein (TIGR02543 family)